MMSGVWNYDFTGSSGGYNMTEYACGHNSKPVFIDGRALTMAHYMVWKETVGFEGTSEQCYRCYCKEAFK